MAAVQQQLSKGCALQEAEYGAEVAAIVVVEVAMHPQQAFPNEVDGPLQLDVIQQFSVLCPGCVGRIGIGI